MNDTTLAVEIVKSYQDLLSHAANKWQGDAFVVIAFHNLEQVYTENLKHHHEVASISSTMNK